MQVKDRIADWGEISGPLLIFGGAHSNRHALDALIALARAEGIPPARVIFTGDALAYCAHPRDTLARLRDWGPRMIAGNMERSLAEGALDCGCNFEDGTACDLMAARWHAHCTAAMDEGARAFLGALPDRAVFTHAGQRVAVIHGAARQVNGWIWPNAKAVELLAEFKALETDTGGPVDRVLAGHCGIAHDRRITPRRELRWLNAGAIGLPPHDGDPRTQYARIDAAGRITLHRLSYDHDAAARDMEAAGLPQGYADALRSGWWPSEDTLPPAFRRLPGEGAA
ncbi:metallophosphoesterase family protein [Rhodovulum sp. DZ06]|uniref:metallophosphoesterase family protein n=1 Tax=Rhodovulum sp. DZ06 TaxID=3425126 RepID=UPI003D33A6A9